MHIAADALNGRARGCLDTLGAIVGDEDVQFITGMVNDYDAEKPMNGDVVISPRRESSAHPSRRLPPTAVSTCNAGFTFAEDPMLSRLTCQPEKRPPAGPVST